MADLNKIIDELSTLTVVEAAELSKQLEEKWELRQLPVAAAPAGGETQLQVARREIRIFTFLSSGW